MADLIDKAAAVKIAIDLAVGIEKEEAEALGWGGPDPRGYHARGIMLDQAKAFRRLAAAIAALPARGVGVDIEDMARTIYDAMRFDRKDKTPEWVKGGNSNAQVEARSTAARILAALAPTDAAQADYEARILAALEPAEAGGVEAPSEDATAKGETDGEMLERLGMDGAKWAAEFRTTALRLGYSDMDEGWLIGWFCNAIMAGYDRAPTPAPVDALVKAAAKNAREVFDGYGSKAREAIDYMEQVALAAIREGRG